MTSEWNKCRKEAIACNKMEDSTIQYIATCKTGSSALTNKLKALYKAKDMMDKSINKTSSASSTSSSSSRASTTVSITYTSFTINVSDTSGITNSTFFVNVASWLYAAINELSGDVDDIGSNSTVRCNLIHKI